MSSLNSIFCNVSSKSPSIITTIDLLSNKLTNLELGDYYLNFLQSYPDHGVIVFKENIVNNKQKITVRRAKVTGNKYSVAWIVKSDVSVCMVCENTPFIWIERHNCRLCGIVVCSECSPYFADISILPEEGGSRMCKFCFTKLIENFKASTIDAGQESLDYASIYRQRGSTVKGNLVLRTEYSEESNSFYFHLVSDTCGGKGNIVANLDGDVHLVKKTPAENSMSIITTIHEQFLPSLSLPSENDADVIKQDIEDDNDVSLGFTEEVKSSSDSPIESSIESPDISEKLSETGNESPLNSDNSDTVIAPQSSNVTNNYPTSGNSFIRNHGALNRPLRNSAIRSGQFAKVGKVYTSEEIVSMIRSGSAQKARVALRNCPNPPSEDVSNNLLHECLDTLDALEESLGTFIVLVEGCHANPNYVDDDGIPPLMKIVKLNRQDIGGYLVSRGADPLFSSNENESALTYSLSLGYPWVLEEFVLHQEETLLSSDDGDRIKKYISCLVLGGRTSKLRDLLEDNKISISREEATEYYKKLMKGRVTNRLNDVNHMYVFLRQLGAEDKEME